LCKALLRSLSQSKEVEIFVTKAKAITAPILQPQAILAFAAAGAFGVTLLGLRLALLLISP
jgi:hypothetical protein